MRVRVVRARTPAVGETGEEGHVLDSIFAADSALMRVLGRFADVVVLNLLFVATSLPLVTLGGSLTALHRTAIQIVRGRCESVTEEYLRAFRANLRQGTVLLAVLLGLAGVLAAWYVVVTVVVAEPAAQLVLLAVWFVLALTLTTTALLAFPYLATFDDPTRRVLRNARLMSWRHPLTTVAILLLVTLPVVVTVFYPQLVGYGLLWLAFGFGAVACLTAILVTRIFDRYIPSAPAERRSENGTARAHP